MGSMSPSTSELLATTLKDAHTKYAKSNPQSKENDEKACQYMPGGNTRTVLYTTPFPLTFKSANSCYLNTIDGQELVDFLGEYTCGIYGHNHPSIRKAIESALDRGWNYGGNSGLEGQLAEIICKRFPEIEMVRFVNSGTEANMMALATVVAVTGKKKILVFNKGYHGSTISGRVESGKPSINLPHEFVVGNYNDVSSTIALVNSLPQNTLAAILVEPVLGSGGCFKGIHSFLSTLRDLATKHKALLIFDEVMTTRLSYHGFGHRLGITPDLMTIGKWVGGGMSFGAFGGRRDIMSLYDPRKGQLEHPGTFNNNVFSMSAGIAGCRLLTEPVITELNDRGDDLRWKIENVLGAHGVVNDQEIPNAPIPDALHDDSEAMKRYPRMFVAGEGSMMTFHFTGPNRAMWQGLFFHHMVEHDIYLAQRGFVSLNIEIKDEHIRKFVEAVEAFVVKWKEQLRN